MRIETVGLVNIRKHENRRFDFAPGVNLLYGENGAGKSTVIEAISFAVFDHLTIKPQSEFIRQGADFGTICVVFEHDGQRWRSERWIGSKTGFDVSKWIDGQWEQVAHGKKNSLPKLHEALGMPGDVDLAKIARDALIPPQGELAAGFSLSETARIDYFTPVLDLDKYRWAWRALHAPWAELGNEISLCQGLLTGLQKGAGDLSLVDAQGGLDAYITDIADLEADVAQRAAQVEELAKAVGALEQQWVGTGDKWRRLEDYQSKIKDLGVKIAGLEAYLPAIERLPERQAELAGITIDPDLQDRYRAVVDEVGQLRGTMLRHNDEAERLSQDYQLANGKALDAGQARRLLPDAEMSLQVMEGKHQKAQIEQGAALSEVSRIDDALPKIEPGKPCPVCGELLTVESAQERQKELEAAKSEAQLAITSTSMTIQDLGAKIDRLRIRIGVYQNQIAQDVNPEEIGDRLRGVMAKALDVGNALEAAEARQTTIKDAVELQRLEEGRKKELEDKIHVLLIKQAEAKDLDDLRAEVVKMQGQIDALQAELDALPTETQINAKIRDLNVDRDNLDRKRDALADARQGKERMEQAIEIIKDANELSGKIAKLEEAQALLVKCRQAINDIGPKVADQAMIQLGALAGKYWKDMGKGGNLTWDGAFLVTMNGLAYRQLSGGEKVIAALACRLAIAKYRADLGFVILDEPTIHLDPNSKQGLAEVVAGALGLGQIIIVSHDDAFTTAATNVVEVGA